MVESGRLPEKGQIGTSIEKLSQRVQERVEYVRVPKTGTIRASNRITVESVRVSKNCPGEYQKRVESV